MRRSLVWNGATTGNRSGNSGRNAGVLTRALPAAVVLFVSVALSLYGLGATPALAQMTPVGVGLTIDKTSVTVGGVFTLTLSANHPEGYHVAFPDVPAQWGEFEVREATPLPAVVEPDGTVTSAIEIRATLFEPGIHTTPALSVAVRRPDGSIINRPARPIEVEVESVLSEGANELRDIKATGGGSNSGFVSPQQTAGRRNGACRAQRARAVSLLVLAAQDDGGER